MFFGSLCLLVLEIVNFKINLKQQYLLMLSKLNLCLSKVLDEWTILTGRYEIFIPSGSILDTAKFYMLLL